MGCKSNLFKKVQNLKIVFSVSQLQTAVPVGRPQQGSCVHQILSGWPAVGQCQCGQDGEVVECGRWEVGEDNPRFDFLNKFYGMQIIFIKFIKFVLK